MHSKVFAKGIKFLQERRGNWTVNCNAKFYPNQAMME